MPPAFEDAQTILKGIGGALIEEVGRVPKMLAAIFDNPNPAGNYRIVIAADLPEEFPERYQAALARGIRDVASGR